MQLQILHKSRARRGLQLALDCIQFLCAQGLDLFSCLLFLIVDVDFLLRRSLQGFIHLIDCLCILELLLIVLLIMLELRPIQPFKIIVPQSPLNLAFKPKPQPRRLLNLSNLNLKLPQSPQIILRPLILKRKARNIRPIIFCIAFYYLV